MKYSLICLAALFISACSLPADMSEAPKLMTYEASEFEPNWFLKLSGGDTLEFTQLDPVAGNDLVTYRYAIKAQTEHPEGWTLNGTGAEGDIVLKIARGQNCTHSGSGYTHRDSVIVTTTAQTLAEKIWKGCGGPILDGE